MFDSYQKNIKRKTYDANKFIKMNEDEDRNYFQ